MSGRNNSYNNWIYDDDSGGGYVYGVDGGCVDIVEDKSIWCRDVESVCDSGEVYYPTPYYEVEGVGNGLEGEGDEVCVRDEYIVNDKLSHEYNKGYYRGELKTRKCEDGSEYLSVCDIFRYVTRGGSVCDSYMECLENYIRCRVSDLESVLERREMLNGSVYMREVPKVSWDDYGCVGSACLEWGVCNPEKVG